MTQKIDIKAITAWDEGDDVKIVCKKNGKRGIVTYRDVEWYFVIENTDAQRDNVKRVLEEYHSHGILAKIRKSDNWSKLIVSRTKEVLSDNRFKLNYKTFIQQLKKLGVECYESDLSAWKRFMIDNSIEIETDFDILYFDIETDDSKKNGIQIGAERILSWAATDTAGNVWFEHGDEETILKKFIELIHSHDMFCGWNSSNFDLPYIQSRMKIYGLEYDWRKKIHIDMMQRAVKTYSYEMFFIGLQGFSLNEVARVFLGEQKVTKTMGITEMYNHDFETFKAYNIKDATLLRSLDQKLMMTDLMIKECNWTGAFLDRFYIGELLDNYILRRTKEIGAYQYSRPDWNAKVQLEDVKIRGGYVMKPITGLHRNVRVCDFKSLYPSVMVGWNIGRDSLNKDLSEVGFINFCKFLGVGTQEERKIEDVEYQEWADFLVAQKALLDPQNLHIQAANNSFFRRDKVSFVGSLVKRLLDERAAWKAQAKLVPKDGPEYKNIMQSQGMVKEMANSMYGITADKSSRYFSQYVAEAITLTGQFMNRTSANFSRKRGYTVIYGDTDSIFILVDNDEDMDQLAKDVNSDLKNYLENEIGVHENIVFLEYEKTYDRLLLLDKKRYTGRMTMYDGAKVDKSFSRGTENIKKNTTKVSRKAIIECVDMLVKDGITDVNVFKRWVEQWKSHILFSNIEPEDLIILLKVSKDPSKYDSKQAHVRLAEKLINEGKLPPVVGNQWGTRMEFIMTIDKETSHQEAILLEDFDGCWDRKYYWDVLTYAPIQRMLECAFPKEDWSVYQVAHEERMLKQTMKLETRIMKALANEEKAAKRVEKKVAKIKKDEEALEKKRQKEREKILKLMKK